MKKISGFVTRPRVTNIIHTKRGDVVKTQFQIVSKNEKGNQYFTIHEKTKEKIVVYPGDQITLEGSFLPPDADGNFEDFNAYTVVSMKTIEELTVERKLKQELQKKEMESTIGQPELPFGNAETKTA